MLFHSYSYVCLLLLTLLVSTLLKPDRRWWALLAASFAFYFAWRPAYLLLLLTTAATCHFAAQAIHALRNKQASQRRIAITLWLAIAFNVGILFLFKYYGLFAHSLEQLIRLARLPVLDLLLPVGISFYTFQAIGYVADVYNRKIKPEPSLARTLLFVSFFPQLVAGPIERASRLLPALALPIYFRWRHIRIGCWLLLWGLFKKVVIADRLSLMVDAAYTDPESQTAGVLLLATYAFAFQIYCDFSGYTDMAIGSAKLFGIDLMTNFRVPYLATSLRDFWARWHISLSTWFRDYLYVPLGGNRCALWRQAINLLVVFAVSGLWHGAKWTFVIWGLIHGLLVVLEVAAGSKARQQTPWPLQLAKCLLTFHIVLLAWIFFRAESLADSQVILSKIFQEPFPIALTLPPEFNKLELTIAVLALGWLHLIEIPYQGQVRNLLGLRPRWRMRVAVAITILLVLNFGVFSHPQQFVYFQF